MFGETEILIAVMKNDGNKDFRQAPPRGGLLEQTELSIKTARIARISRVLSTTAITRHNNQRLKLFIFLTKTHSPCSISQRSGPAGVVTDTIQLSLCYERRCRPPHHRRHGPTPSMPRLFRRPLCAERRQLWR